MEIQTTLESQLEIIIPTYNRKANLEHTLVQLTAPESPVRNCSIMVLDNASTDGTAEVIEQFAAKFKNITSIRHRKNIGGNANITRAFELAKAEYVWVVCDDDKYDFTHAHELAQILQTKPAAVFVVQHTHSKLGIGELFQECSFVPAAIYRTEFITGDTLINMYFENAYMFPHLAVTANVLNAGKEILSLPHPLVLRMPSPAYTRGLSGTGHPFIREMDWILGYLITALLLTNPKHHNDAVHALDIDGDNFYNLCGRFMSLPKNKILLYGLGLRVFPGIMKLGFACLAWPAYICSFYKTARGRYVRLFGKFKAKISC